MKPLGVAEVQRCHYNAVLGELGMKGKQAIKPPGMTWVQWCQYNAVLVECRNKGKSAIWRNHCIPVAQSSTNKAEIWIIPRTSRARSRCHNR